MLPSVLGILGRHGTGSDWWRGVMPFSYLQRQGLPVAWAESQDESVGTETGLYDLIVLLRLLFPSAHDAKGYVRVLHRHGKVVIMDVDDDLVIHADFIRPALDEQKARELSRHMPLFRGTLQYVDGITCTTPHLAARMATVTNKPVAVAPNLLDLEWWRQVQFHGKRVSPADKVVIGWIGGARNALDVAEMLPAWTAVAELRPDVHFLIAGNPPDGLVDCVPPTRVTRAPWVAPEQYPALYLSADIGCCPLAPSSFNWSKSPIKAIEHGATRTPVVVSPTVYGTSMENGAVARTTEAWVGHLLRLVDDSSARFAEGEALYGEVERNWSLQRNWRRFPLAWQEIMDQNAARLRSRVLTLADA